MQGEIDDVLEKSNQEEVDFMVSNLGKTIERMQDKAIEKGIEKKAKETAIKLGMSNEIIIELTGLTDEEVNNIRKEQSH